MKILFCSPTPLLKELGMSNTLLGLSAEMSKIGWHCETIFLQEIFQGRSLHDFEYFLQKMYAYLREQATNYDVIEYDHSYLPFPRSEFPRETLLVARCQLLLYYLQTIRFPIVRKWKSKIRYYLIGGYDQRKHRRQLDRSCRRIDITTREADLLTVLNEDDKRELIKRGIGRHKVAVIPNGISDEAMAALQKLQSQPPESPVIAYIGTFDNRKGAADFPKIVQCVAKSIPAVRFRLLGTAGMYQTEKEVLTFFPKKLRHHLQIVPRFPAENLPDLLSSCAVGIFPSYCESFGLGVLEMLAAAIPVVAYDIPGPSMMLTPEYLVPRGDFQALANKIVALLSNRQRLWQARKWAQQRAQPFCWSKIAQKTSEIYKIHWQQQQ